MSQQILSGNARYQGVPAFTVTWTNPNSGTGSITATIFSEVSKSSGAGIDYEQTGNDGELTGIVTGRRFYDLSFSAFPVGSTSADALTVAEAMPFINTELEITHSTPGTDVQIEGTCYCKGATVRYTPDGDAVLDIQARKYITGNNTEVDLT